jgi:hypothetical protein
MKARQTKQLLEASGLGDITMETEKATCLTHLSLLLSLSHPASGGVAIEAALEEKKVKEERLEEHVIHLQEQMAQLQARAHRCLATKNRLAKVREELKRGREKERAQLGQWEQSIGPLGKKRGEYAERVSKLNVSSFHLFPFFFPLFPSFPSPPCYLFLFSSFLHHLKHKFNQISPDLHLETLEAMVETSNQKEGTLRTLTSELKTYSSLPADLSLARIHVAMAQEELDTLLMQRDRDLRKLLV